MASIVTKNAHTPFPLVSPDSHPPPPSDSSFSDITASGLFVVIASGFLMVTIDQITVKWFVLWDSQDQRLSLITRHISLFTAGADGAAFSFFGGGNPLSPLFAVSRRQLVRTSDISSVKEGLYKKMPIFFQPSTPVLDHKSITAAKIKRKDATDLLTQKPNKTIPPRQILTAHLPQHRSTKRMCHIQVTAYRCGHERSRQMVNCPSFALCPAHKLKERGPEYIDGNCSTCGLYERLAKRPSPERRPLPPLPEPPRYEVRWRPVAQPKPQLPPRRQPEKRPQAKEHLEQDDGGCCIVQ